MRDLPTFYIHKSITSYMNNFVVISNIIWLKAHTCDGQVAKDKQSLNVWQGIFHPIVIKDKS